MNRSIYTLIAIPALWLNGLAVALAQEAGLPESLARVADEPGSVTPATAEETRLFEPPLWEAVVSEAQLATNRGGHTETNTNNLDATLYDNQAISNVTGSNYITTEAFSGTSGIPTVIQNSGNNVLIQNATILNLKLQ